MLPSNFTQLEYIESSGTQYVDTNFKPNQNTKLEIKVQTTQTTGGGIAVCDTAWQSNGFGIWVNAAGYGNATTQNVAFYGEEPIAAILDRNTLYKDGELVWTATESTFQTLFNLTLMALNRNGSPQEKVTGKIYCCKIWDNGTLIRNFIPCKNDAGEVGLWDDVNREFYGNAGTGTFASGPVVPQEMAESDIVELEYIESTGVQSVDTRFVPNQDTRIVLKYGGCYESAWAEVLGAGESSSSPNNNFLIVQRKTTGVQAQYGAEYYAAEATSDGAVIDLNKNLYYVNSALVHTFTYTDFTSPYSVCLFDAAVNNSDAYPGYSGKIYYCQIYDNGTLVRDFIPAKTVAGEIGLYDKVLKEFYRNAGSGVFTAGPEILVEPPVVPENFRMVRASRTAISIAWDAVENATSYQLDQNGARVLDANVTSYTASGLAQETEYTFSLTAVNRSGASEAVTLTAKTTALVLITDRTRSDVTARNDKGTYGASDLIRVGDAVSYLQGLLEQLGHLVPVEPKVDWTEYDWPTPSTMQRYLQDVETVRSKLTLLSTTPKTPDSMEYLTHTKANDIEQILLDVDAVISVLKKTVVPCGAATCGGDYL